MWSYTDFRQTMFYFDGLYVGDVNEYDEISIDLRFMGEYIEKE